MDSVVFIVIALIVLLWRIYKDGYEENSGEQAYVSQLNDKIKKEYTMEEKINSANEDWAKNQLEKVEEETKPLEEKTRELMTEILTKWSCQWGVDKDGTVQFSYQGGQFNARFSDSVFVTVTYYPFYSVESYLKDRMEKAKTMVNEMNRRGHIQIIYYIDPDDGDLYVYAEDTILLIPEIPQIETYLKTLLDRFFHHHHALVVEMEEEGE